MCGGVWLLLVLGWALLLVLLLCATFVPAIVCVIWRVIVCMHMCVSGRVCDGVCACCRVCAAVGVGLRARAVGSGDVGVGKTGDVD